ncbi:hypothetical protein ACWGB8_37535 [Kitasatospora sp. NPDC054939]
MHPVHRPTDTPRPALLDLLRRTADDPGRRILFTGATVVTMDPALGTLPAGDLLVTGDTVLIAGQVRKWAGRVLDVDLPALRAEAAASRDRILHAASG